VGIFEILAVAVGLAMDAFAVSLAASVKLQPVSRRQIFRFAWHFGLFQALMPVLGWLAGRSILDVVGAFDHWIAFGLLGFIGGRAIVSALRGEESDDVSDPTRGLSLVMYSVATSIDALAVGLSLGVMGVAIWVPAAVIGVVTAVLTTIGMLVGSRLGARFGRRVEVVGGLVLIGIGVKILVEHLGGA
jgi:putative Mn2+ efflux pump MntP